MLRFVSVVVALVATASLFAQGLNIIPRPQSIQMPRGGKPFIITPRTAIVTDIPDSYAAKELQRWIGRTVGKNPELSRGLQDANPRPVVLMFKDSALGRRRVPTQHPGRAYANPIRRRRRCVLRQPDRATDAPSSHRKVPINTPSTRSASLL